MSFIDKNKLAEMIRAKADTLIEGKEAFFYVANWIDKLPDADVVEVVRCKDCEHWKWWCTDPILNIDYGYCCCLGHDESETASVDFCSDGKRKGGVTDTNVGGKTEKSGEPKDYPPYLDLPKPVYCKDCEYLMFSDMYGECKKQLRIVNPTDTCPMAKRRAKNDNT